MVVVCALQDFARAALSSLGDNEVLPEGVTTRLEIVEELEAVRPATTDVALWNTGFAVEILAERPSSNCARSSGVISRPGSSMECSSATIRGMLGKPSAGIV